MNLILTGEERRK